MHWEWWIVVACGVIAAGVSGWMIGTFQGYSSGFADGYQNGMIEGQHREYLSSLKVGKNDQTTTS